MQKEAKEASKVIQTTKQSNATHPRQHVHLYIYMYMYMYMCISIVPSPKITACICDSIMKFLDLACICVPTKTECIGIVLHVM